MTVTQKINQWTTLFSSSLDAITLTFRFAVSLHFALSVCCIALLWLGSLVAPTTLIFLTLLCACVKSWLYCTLLRRLVVRSTALHSFLRELTWLSFIAIFSFAVDFFLIYTTDKTSLGAMDPKWSNYETFFNCWYFSVLNFSFFGVSDIVPASFATKLLLTVEALMAFLTVMFVLSDFVALRDGLSKPIARARVAAERLPPAG